MGKGGGKSDILVSTSIRGPTFSSDLVANTSYTLGGTRSYTVTSPHLDHYSDSGNTVLDKPILNVYEEGNSIGWSITAQRGILDGKRVITLYDNVVATNFLTDPVFYSIKTKRLSIDLVKKDFWTDSAVFLTGPQFNALSQAMRGNFIIQEAKLCDHVQIEYETLFS